MKPQKSLEIRFSAARQVLSFGSCTDAACQLNVPDSARLKIVTKAKQNCVAYKPPVRKTGRGRPPKKGKKVVLRELFSSDSSRFTKAELKLYGKRQ